MCGYFHQTVLFNIAIAITMAMATAIPIILYISPKGIFYMEPFLVSFN